MRAVNLDNPVAAVAVVLVVSLVAFSVALAIELLLVGLG